MSNIKKADLLSLIEEQAEIIVELSGFIEMNKRAIIKLENEREQPKLKRLNQSIFDGLDEKLRFAAVNKAGRLTLSPSLMVSDERYWRCQFASDLHGKDTGYDTTDWQNSLIERDKVELTGSDLCRAMLSRGDKHIMCFVGDLSESAAIKRGLARIVTGIHKGRFETNNTDWSVAIPINSQGEPLTQSDVGL